MAQSDRPIPLGGWLPPRMFVVSLALQAPGIALTWPPRPNAIELAAGGALIARGLALDLWADATFTRARVEVVPFGATPRLTDEGPFRYSRNPMVLGMATASSGPGDRQRRPLQSRVRGGPRGVARPRVYPAGGTLSQPTLRRPIRILPPARAALARPAGSIERARPIDEPQRPRAAFVRRKAGAYCRRGRWPRAFGRVGMAERGASRGTRPTAASTIRARLRHEEGASG